MKFHDGQKWVDPSANSVAVRNLSSTLSPLNSVKVEAILKFRENTAEGGWIQGFSFDQDENMYYLGTQGTTEYKIQRVDASTGVKIDQKSFTITSGAYAESLPFWKDGSGNLLFMVRTGAGSTVYTYNIYNYTKGTLGPQIPIKGNWRAGQFGDYLVSSDNWTTNVKNFYVYSWESIKSGSPELLSTVSPSNFGEIGRKNQGLQYLNGKFYTQQATVGENPTINEYSPSGVLEGTYQWNLRNFGDLVNEHLPGTIPDTSSFKSEGEGLFYKGNQLLSGWSINEGDIARYVILSHGSPDGKVIQPNSVPDPNANSLSNFSMGGVNCWFKRQGVFVSVWLDGMLTTSIDAGSTQTIGTIEAKYRPARTIRIPGRIGSYAMGMVDFKSDGTVTLMNLGSGPATFISTFSGVYDISF